MSDCINLCQKFGATLRVVNEESYSADRGDNARAEDSWMSIVPCQNGHIGPYGGDELFASTTRSGAVAKALRALDCCRVWMDGADGLNVVFNVADAKQVFAVMKPRRRRQLSPEQKARLAELGRANLERLRSANVQNAPGERQRERTAPGGPEAIPSIGSQNRARGAARSLRNGETDANTSVGAVKSPTGLPRRASA